jgi:hypothetical protein
LLEKLRSVMTRELVKLVIRKGGGVFHISLTENQNHFDPNEMICFALALPIECEGVRGYRLLRNYRSFLPEDTSDIEAREFGHEAMSFFESVFFEFAFRERLSDELSVSDTATRRALVELMQNSEDVFGNGVLSPQEVKTHEENFMRLTEDWFESCLVEKKPPSFEELTKPEDEIHARALGVSLDDCGSRARGSDSEFAESRATVTGTERCTRCSGTGEFRTSWGVDGICCACGGTGVRKQP